MKNKIIINKLGPINKLEMDISNNLNLVIGPQASGKSTLGKILYFCKKIRDYTIDFLDDDDTILGSPMSELYLSFLKFIRKRYMESFGTTRHYSRQFHVEYYYGTNKKVIIKLDTSGYVKFRFSEELEKSLKEIITTARKLYEDHSEQEAGLKYDSIIQRIQIKKESHQHFVESVYDIFCDSTPVLYIPAGRSLLSVLSDQLDVVNTAGLDLPMKDFVEKIRSTKSRFGTKLDMVVSDYVKTIKGQIKNTNVDIAGHLISQILKAEYVNDSDGEKLFIDDTRWVKLIYGSSGQQEALWILLLLFIIILENKKTFVIIEEPEAHLYPDAQMEIMKLIALTLNSSASQLFITTHSPYIMTSANLLVYSGIAENRTSKARPIIAKQYRIDPKQISAYKFNVNEENKFMNICNDDGLIRAEELDTISGIINQKMDELIDLEIHNDL